MMDRNERKRQLQAKLLVELEKTPIVATAVKRVGIDRSTYYRWREEDGDFEVAADIALASGQDVINDLAESKLISGINDREFQFIKLWLTRHHPQYVGPPGARLPFRRHPLRFLFDGRTDHWKDRHKKNNS